jgi:hypothetical protein
MYYGITYQYCGFEAGCSFVELHSRGFFGNTKVALAGSQRTTKDTKRIIAKPFIILKHPEIRETKGHEAPDGVV